MRQTSSNYEYRKAYDEDLRHQAGSGVAAIVLCSPLIPFLPADSTLTVYERYGASGCFFVFLAAVMLILLASMVLAAQSAAKKTMKMKK